MDKDGDIVVTLDVNRKIFVDENLFKVTDFTWYLTKLLPAFTDKDLRYVFFLAKSFLDLKKFFY